MQHVPELGKLIEGTAYRDAVHIAVAPVVADNCLSPGEHVGIRDGRVSELFLPHVGVVDPFLRQDVSKEDRLYLFLYPNTITSLRHVWSHPAFRIMAPGLPAVPAEARNGKEDER